MSLSAQDVKKCTICSCDLDDECPVRGYFGILPVAFCSFCYSCIIDFVDELKKDEIDETVESDVGVG